MDEKRLEYYIEKEIAIIQKGLDGSNIVCLNPVYKVEIYKEVKELIDKSLVWTINEFSNELKAFIDNAIDDIEINEFLRTKHYEWNERFSICDYSDTYKKFRESEGYSEDNEFYFFMTAPLDNNFEYVNEFLKSKDLSIDDFKEWQDWMVMEDCYLKKELVRKGISKVNEMQREISVPYKIFKSKERYKNFIELVENLGYTKLDGGEYGFKAVAHAIRVVDSDKKFLFIERCSLKRYIEFLNEEFNMNQKYFDNLSKSTNRVNGVESMFGLIFGI